MLLLHLRGNGEQRLLLILSLVSILFIGGALYLQFFQHADPCPLCILQRYAYLLIALFAFIGAIMSRVYAKTIAKVLTLVVTTAGIITAGRHIWILKHPFPSCGFDTLQPIIDKLPPAKILPSVFKVAGLCETSGPVIFGLSLAEWSLIGYLLIFIIASFSLWSPWQHAQPQYNTTTNDSHSKRR